MVESLYLGFSKAGRQIGLFKTHEQAFENSQVHEAKLWNLDEKTGQYHPTNGSVCRLEMLPKKQR